MSIEAVQNLFNEVISKLNYIKGFKNIYIIAADLRAIALAKFLKAVNSQLDIYIINDRIVQNKYGIRTILISQLYTINYHDSVIITENDYDKPEKNPVFHDIPIIIGEDKKNIKTQVKIYPYLKEINIVELDNHFMNRVQRLMTPMTKRQFRFQVHLADHCNLNCQMCTHFSPLADKKFLDIVQYTNDLKRLSYLFGDIGVLMLMGSEPLLNPDIVEIIKISRHYFPHTSISVTTNGLLLSTGKHPIAEKYWQACKDYNIYSVFTKYPANINYDNIVATAQKYGVNYTLFGIFPGHPQKTSSWLPFNTNKVEAEEFIFCYELNNCINLKEGKIYPCPKAAYVESLNKAFNVNFISSAGDYIDIYKAKDAEEILEFVSSRIPFCDYCDNPLKIPTGCLYCGNETGKQRHQGKGD